MIAIPAIDLIEGQVVRLRKGNYAEKTVYPGEPESYVVQWQEAGARRIHVVDLEGARTGEVTEWHTIERIVGVATVPIELGGGLRAMKDLEHAFLLGVQFGILGTAVLKNRSFVQEALRKFPGRVLIGVDVLDGKLRAEGWTEATTTEVTDACKQLADWSAHEIIYTNIDKDGVLGGPDIAGLRKLLNETSLKIILSGGISRMDDIRKLAKIQNPRLTGFIFGRALYEGTIKLEEAVRVLK